MFKVFVLTLCSLNLALSTPTPDRRIVGGGTVALGQMPFMASIRNFGSLAHFQGGVIIGPRHVLTSAHYLVGRADDSLHVVAGIIDITTFIGQDRRSQRITVHSHFDSNSRQNDIAVVEISAPFMFSATVTQIFIVSEFISNSVLASTAGWGSTDEMKGENSQFLRRLDVVTHSCTPTTENVQLSPQGIFTKNDFTNICASAVRTGGICTTDVGGPLVAMSGLIGIASWHRLPCGMEPDVYVRISWYRNWIRSVSGI